jgi:replicative DNA helicase
MFTYGPGSPVLGEVQRAAEAFGVELRCSPGHEGKARLTAGRGTGPNPVRVLCEQHGQWGKRSATKYVPEAIFGLDDAGIARFLSVLFGCDGYVHAARLRHIGYTTISERLARDVQHLLLRLGIVSVIRSLPRTVYAGTDVVAREVRITGQDDLRTFAGRIRIVGKEDRLDRLVSDLDQVQPSTYADNFPLGIWDYMLTAKWSRSWADISEATGRPQNHNWHVGQRQLSRRLVTELAAATDDRVLPSLADSHLWWDEVASIEAAGVEETYDLTVPEHHNFVADDVVVHNSSLVTNIAENAAVNHTKPVALFSLEMSETELAQRFIASQARLSGDDLRKGRVKKDRWPKVVQATEKLARAPLYVDDSSDIGVTEIRAKARRLHARFADQGGLGLLIVDYLQLMRVDDTSIGRVEQIAHMSRGLKILARELDIPVIAVSQLSRAVEARPDKRPLLSDLRESGAIEQDADVVIFIYRDEYYNKESERPGEADLIVAKHRNGPIGEVTLTFLPRYPKFANFAREPAAEAAARQIGG